MPQHELLACAQCGCFAFSCFEDFAIRVKKYNHRTGLGGGRVINVWPEDTYSSHSVKDQKYRFNWTYPILFSPHDPDVLYVAGNVVFRSADLGQSWDIISPDLTKNGGCPGRC